MTGNDGELQRIDCDVLIAGSGAAGLTAAVTAALHGLTAIVAEAADTFGGTTARSGGVLWIPQSHYAEEAGVRDSREAVRTYLRHELGNLYNSTMIEAYLDSGPQMLRFLADKTVVEFTALTGAPDYHPDVEGAAKGGRSLRTVAYDAGGAGDDFERIGWPIEQTMLFGRMMISGEDLGAFLTWSRSPRSFFKVAGRIAGYGLDRLRSPRGRRLANGNALVGRLLKSCRDAKVELWRNAPIRQLIHEGSAVVGAVVEKDGRRLDIRARLGTVLATGGFASSSAMRAELYPAAYGEPVYSMATPEADGAGIRLGRGSGGAVDLETSHPTVFVPASRLPGPQRTGTLFPHLLDRNKPGMIAVTAQGERFVSEACSYQDFVPAMVNACHGRSEVSCFLLCDHRALRLYGLGPVRPFPFSIRPWLRNGYLTRADTIVALAAKLGIEAATLDKTVARYNALAQTGRDLDFDKGGNAYERSLGDSLNKPNPNMAALEKGPFYGVKLLPGDIGTMRGLYTDEYARVLNGSRHPIPGLYAVGNDMANVMAGTYPGGGVTLGPGMAFAYRAALDMVGRDAAAHPARTAA